MRDGQVVRDYFEDFETIFEILQDIRLDMWNRQAELAKSILAT